jgi:ribonuclease-3
VQEELDLARCQEVIGYHFHDPEMLRLALTHASAAPNRVASNERLEFLGDAVLGLVICEEIFRSGPKLLEGEMTKVKSSVVSRATCGRVAREVGLAELLVLGKGVGDPETMPNSLAAAVLESIIGAIHIDGGFEPAREFILTHMRKALDQAMACSHQRNYKSLLQQYAQRHWSITPQYSMLDEKGPEHAKCFEVAVRVDGQKYPSAWGNSKKHAEQKAALAALQELGVVDADEQVDETADDPGDEID